MSKEVELGKILNGVTISGDISATSFAGDGSSVTGVTPADGSVTAAKIATNAVATAKIIDGAITQAKIAAGSIDTTEIADGAVTADKLNSTLDLSGKTITNFATTGDVGIGTASPEAKLHVAGQILAGSGAGTNLIIDDGLESAKWGLATGNSNLSFQKNNGSGTYETKVTFTSDGNIQHYGLTPTSGFDIDQVWTVTKSIQVTTDWQDTGIDSSHITSWGSYMIQMYVDNYDVAGQEYQEFYTGVMSWRGATNSTLTDEIMLHAAGHAPDAGGRTYLRTRRSYNVDGGKMYLQIKGTLNLSAADNYIFKFRRMM